MRIDDLPTFKNFEENRLGFKVLLKICSFFRIFGIKNKKLDEMKQQCEELGEKIKEQKKYATKFNNYFSNDGWIVHGLFSYEFMKKAVDSFESKGMEEAKKLLLEHFNPKNIEERLFLVRSCKEMQVRYRFLQYALEDYKEGRYHSAIPVLLMTIDGVVADVAPKGFHAKAVDLDVWDAITTVDGGINKLKEIFQRPRNKTRSEPIFLPYRHGILHGRDLSYDNYEVAAKSWCFLFAITDWVQSKTTEEDRKTKFIEERKPFSFREFLKGRIEREEINKKMTEWKPRKLDSGYIHSINKDAVIDKDSPEYIAVEYFKLWVVKNYGHMSKLYGRSWKLAPGELRDMYDGWEDISGFEVVSIKNDAPAAADVIISANFEKMGIKLCHVRLIHEREDGTPLPSNMSGAQWRIVLIKID
ncbi:MAG: hypothetical protein KAJ66_07155 [Candidatus Omnitrophica bacterium]|nr:hypothetical protein [Candidatus Omnitrophota bacterium]